MSAAAVTKYPVPASHPRLPVPAGAYLAIYLAEFGFPPVLGEDRDRLDALLHTFLNEQRQEAGR